MIRSVIFDLDDTLYDYKKCDQYATQQLLRFMQGAFGLQEQQGLDCIKKAKQIVKDRLGNTAACHNRMLYMQTISELCHANPIQYSWAMYNAYWDTLLAHLKLFPYVKPLFALLKKNNIKIAILSDLTAHIQHRKLIQLGVAEDIDVLVTSEEAGAEKPSPKMFELVVSKLSFDKMELLMVGDSLQKDVQGAMHCGIPAVWFSENKRETGQRTGKEVIQYIKERIEHGYEFERY